uniref:Integrase zinc-binding domain-containing protein n=1 Tax=Amphimedon queenslandica TaxID=400682 RepID=A0A1X7UW87_AMPQE
VLHQLHLGHQGIVKCKKRARFVWWSEITSNIIEYMKSCRTCCQYLRQKFEAMGLTKLPETLWQKVWMDLFEWKQTPYLKVVDYYSRYRNGSIVNDHFL